MNAMLTLAAKDLRLLSRDRMGLFWVFVFPVLLAVLFGVTFHNPGTTGAARLPVTVADEDRSKLSQRLCERLQASSALIVEANSDAVGREAVRVGRQVACVVIPNGFELRAGLWGGETVEFELHFDPAHHAEAALLDGVLREAVLALLQEDLADAEKLRAAVEGAELGVRFDTELSAVERAKLEKFLGHAAEYLRDADPQVLQRRTARAPLHVKSMAIARAPGLSAHSFEITFPVGMVWGMLGCVATFAVALARERTTRTLQRLRLAPLSATQVLAGKGLACLAACLATMGALIFVGHVFFGVRMVDPAGLALAVFCNAACFAGLMSGIGTLGRTEQATAGAGWAILLLLALFGGAMMPQYLMPGWAQNLGQLSPVQWGIRALEGALWRGFALQDLVPLCAGLLLAGGAGFAFGAVRLAREP